MLWNYWTYIRNYKHLRKKAKPWMKAKAKQWCNWVKHYMKTKAEDYKRKMISKAEFDWWNKWYVYHGRECR